MSNHTEFRQGQRVTDSDGNRAKFVRIARERDPFHGGRSTSIVRYVGERHDCVCETLDLVAGWSKAAA